MKYCHFCDHEFQDISKLKRHLNNKILCIDKIDKIELLNKLNNKITNLIQENELLKTQLKNNECQPNNTNSITNVITTNNGNITNNVTNNVTNVTVKINSISKEEVCQFDHAYFLDACLSNVSNISELLDVIHTNDECPSNHNIYKKNTKLHEYYVKTDNGKSIIKSTELAKQLLKRNIERIECRLELCNYTENEKEEIKEYLNYIKQEPKELIEEIIWWLKSIHYKIEKPLWVSDKNIKLENFN